MTTDDRRCSVLPGSTIGLLRLETDCGQTPDRRLKHVSVGRWTILPVETVLERKSPVIEPTVGRRVGTPAERAVTPPWSIPATSVTRLVTWEPARAEWFAVVGKVRTSVPPSVSSERYSASTGNRGRHRSRSIFRLDGSGLHSYPDDTGGPVATERQRCRRAIGRRGTCR